MCVETELIERLLRRAPEFDTVRDAYVWVKIHFMMVGHYIDPEGSMVVAEIAEVLYRAQHSAGV